ncbi:MAG TPA: recombinase family protein [Chitinophagaceae bacterium]|nr:recombinase family protein [Chitinophagaceae bacterium]
MKKAIGYTRISRKDQSNFSLPGQDRYLKEFARELDVEIIASFADKGRSAKDFDRPNWQKLEAFIKEHHKTVDYLLIIKYDRLIRNVAQGLQKIEMLEQKYHIIILSFFERMFIDYDSPFYFKQRADILVAAEFELRIIRDRTMFGIHSALSLGRFINHAPVGYKNSRDEKNEPIIIIDEEKAHIIRRIFSMYLSGSTIKEIYIAAQYAGLHLKGHSAIQRILSNCVYAGLIYVPAYRKDPSEHKKGIHEPIITEHDWRTVQYRLGKAKPRIVLNNEVPLRGLLKCHCGKELTAGNSRSKSGRYYWYYKCNNHKQINLPAAKLHTQFDEILYHLSLRNIHIEYLTDVAIQEMKQQLQNREKNMEDLRRELAGTLNNIDRLEEKFITGEISSDTYKKWHNKYLAAESATRYQLSELETNSEAKWRLFQEQLPRLSSLQTLYNDASLSEKRIFLRQVFNSQLSYDDGIYRTPYILPLFSHNILILKQKRLLLIEQPSQLPEEKLQSTRDGS